MLTTPKSSTLIPAALAAAIVALTLYAYRELPARPFAADDYQWLLNVHGLSFTEVAGQAFDPRAQSHFFRPLVWLLFWAQTRAFGLDPRGFHAVSLGLHLLNAGLLGWMAYRLTADHRPPTTGTRPHSSSLVFGLWSALAAGAIVALHPAPFEAVVWASSQSELLAAALLLAALHLWLCRRTTKDKGPKEEHQAVERLWSFVFRPWSLFGTIALALALLAKESAVIGLPLLIMVERSNVEIACPEPDEGLKRSNVERFAPYLLPALMTIAYVALQIGIERRNYLLEQGGYGFGPQLVLNPLRSLALIVAPLPATEHADADWLAPLGAVVAIALLIFLILNFRLGIDKRRRQSKICNLQSKIVLALALTLLPTAPFVSPPDSRYLYLPVMAAALLIAFLLDQRPTTKDQSLGTSAVGPWSFVFGLILALVLAGWASGELHAREGRFAVASGPGGSLWRLASAVCAEGHPDRMVIVEPPLAPPHVEAIVGLACADTRTKIVGHDQIDKAIKGHSLVIAFPNGSAEIERRT
ncbi:MAG TPA: hypothetical protein VKE41_23615 [Roseiflexaceae bacterium]|nr:hypothetical protein [Roseiflexaceae bacterium]